MPHTALSFYEIVKLNKSDADIDKFNPYHDSKGRFTTSGGGASFSGTLLHGSPNKGIKEFDINRAGSNTGSGEKLLFFTNDKQLADDFSYERLPGSTKFMNVKGKKGEVYRTKVKMKKPLDLRNLSDDDIKAVKELDADGILTDSDIKTLAGMKNHGSLKAALDLRPETLSRLGYDGIIANAGNGKTEFAVIDSKQTKIVHKTFSEVLKSKDTSENDVDKFNPYHDRLGRFTTGGGASSFTFRTKNPSKQHMADMAIAREKERATSGASVNSNETESKRKQAVHKVEDKIRDQFYESAALVDNDGKVLFFKDGSQNQVGFTKRECDMMKDNTLTHNHPGSSIFSVEDTFAFVNNDMREIRATTREGITYSISRGEGYTRERGKRFVIDYDGEMKSARLVAQKELDAKHYYTKIIDGEITQEQANRDFGKVMTREMETWAKQNAPRYNINFSVEKRKVKNKYNVSEYTGKSYGGEYMILDDETDRKNKESFDEWMNSHRKNDDTHKSLFRITKADEDQRLVFGWALVSERTDGQQIIDHQGDIVDPDELEKGAYEYVLNFRDAGEEHLKGLRKKAKMVESCVFTPEKMKALGIPEGTVPVGWWIGFHVDDDDTWEKIKNGTYNMFSIEGKAVREPVNEPVTKSENEPFETVAKTFSEVLKFNPYHDRLGRFTSGSGGNYASFTYAPGKSKAHDNAIAREKERAKERASQMASANNKKKTTEKKPKKKVESYSDVKNKNDFVDYVEHQHNVRLNNDKNDSFNRKRDILYTQIPKDKQNTILSDFKKKGIRYEQHLGDNYWVYYKSGKVSKSFNEILEDIEKFNPYHDRLGRFATGGGFMNSSWSGPADKQARTFSANPNTRAGAMAIARESALSHETIGRAYGLGGTKPAPGNKQPKPQKPKPQKPKAEKPKEEKPQESNFTPAKTKKAATEYAVKELGFEKASYGTKLDIDTINHINKQVADIQSKYPETKGAVQEIKMSSSGRMYACIETDGTGRMTLKLSSKLYGNGLEALEQQYKADCDIGFHPKGTTAKDIVWHEYGHVIGGIQAKKSVGVAANETISNFDGSKKIDFIMNKRSGKWEKEVFKKATGKIYGGNHPNTKDFASKISKYATKNAKELFAEAFAEFNGSSNPSPECLALMKAAGILK